MIKPLSPTQIAYLSQQKALWIDNPPRKSRLPEINLTHAQSLWQRFAPFFARTFNDVPDNGMIESPLIAIASFQAALNQHCGLPESPKLWLKSDDCLPVVGSVKARGGIFEVCQFAEKIAQQAGLLTKESDYNQLHEKQFRQLFEQYRILVGSTGNLGLSIGTVAAALGFQVSVHMSADAKAWKKSALRAKGVKVIEHQGTYAAALAAGRKEAAENPFAHFVDDEQSLELFTGYASAGKHFAQQYRQHINTKAPLYIYLPCGVGGAPAGIAYGIKKELGEQAHFIIVEPTAAPALLSFVMGNGQNAQAFGLNGQTIADGLAVSQASTLAGQVLTEYADAFCTVCDDDLLKAQSLLLQTENHYLEPSACAGLIAWAAHMRLGCDPQAQHIIWATGGSIVPAQEREHNQQQAQKVAQKPFRLPERATA